MQFNTIVAVLVAATGVIAAPGFEKPKKPSVVINKPVIKDSGNNQNINCGGGSPYCCIATTDKGGKNYFECSVKDSCNQIITCCSNQGSGSANCLAFGNSPVIIV